MRKTHCESNDEELLAATESCVRDRMAGQAAGHGIDHVLRVLSWSRIIQGEAGGDRLVIELASLLHDVGDAKFHEGVERSGEFAREILSDLDADAALIESVEHIVDNLSFRKRDSANPLSLEGQIVQDADRLDALGAIGIVRTIEYGAVFRQPFYSPGGDDEGTGIGHIREKLLKLKYLMNTETAKRIAEQRDAFVRQFLEQFLRECGERDK